MKEPQLTAESPAPAASRSPGAPRAPRIHYGWIVVAVSLLVLMGSAGFRSAPSLMMDALHDEFGWSRATISSAVSVNLALYGVTAPFAAALMDRFGVRPVVVCALLAIATGSGLSILMTRPWQLVLGWGVVVGLGSGSMAGAFATTVSGRWFQARQGLVTGVLTAAGAAGNLVFMPLLAALVERHGWRTAVVLVSLCATAVAVPVLLLMRERPADVGQLPYGATEAPAPAAAGGSAVARTLRVLRTALRQRVFWLLAGSFAICGATTVGLVGTHFIPAAHDHGMPVTTGASLLALIGLFDIAGTVASGWFTDRFDSTGLLITYYTLRGLSLACLPALFGESLRPPILAFVIFYGLDWVATVPPTVALCRRHFGADAPVVFGWVLAAHQLGAAAVAGLAGLARDSFGDYDATWYAAGGLCAVAVGCCVLLRRGGPVGAPA
ncbi:MULTISPECIES: MFS transporter [Kitasatospora]|uniref:Putative major facilitator superfamily transporter n=1 Tax=Kitasatospora setae (strain ATCC 33774 / DSM 43861 / JCM 3304 / KCC A-0304 / NBRC 14216 / KM-6054) TaxID=452652 RepID=E4NFJ1_KITSK|nr:MFS transporter [Kitasatospora setae]BAJ30271.1 putative major facilitator superfamily transporter [Kitasatospora setae KM-6054]